MTSTVTRLPAEIAAQAKAVAKAQGRPIGEVLADAWTDYYEAHRDQIATDFETAAALIRNKDTAGLVAHMNRHNDSRSVAAAERAAAKR